MIQYSGLNASFQAGRDMPPAPEFYETCLQEPFAERHRAAKGRKRHA